MSIFDDIRRDREAGTPGPWEVKYQGETHLYMNGDSQMCDMTYYPWVPDKTADWERIARVPDLERIALAAEELLKECDRIAPIVGEAIEAHGLGDKHGIATANVFRSRIAKLREASK